METCKTCRWWCKSQTDRKLFRPTYGKCVQLPHIILLLDGNWGTVEPFRDPYNKTFIFTHKDFGCTHYEPEEKDNADKD